MSVCVIITWTATTSIIYPLKLSFLFNRFTQLNLAGFLFITELRLSTIVKPITAQTANTVNVVFLSNIRYLQVFTDKRKFFVNVYLDIIATSVCVIPNCYGTFAFEVNGFSIGLFFAPLISCKHIHNACFKVDAQLTAIS